MLRFGGKGSALYGRVTPNTNSNGKEQRRDSCKRTLTLQLSKTTIPNPKSYKQEVAAASNVGITNQQDKGENLQFLNTTQYM